MASKTPQTFSDINITPLTDIFLVLLIIMMVVAPMLETSGLKLATPSIASSEDQEEEPKVLRVFLSSSNTIEVNGTPLSPVDLRKTLRQEKDSFPDGVVIEVHPDSNHETMTLIMDSVQAANISKLAVSEATEPSQQADG